MGPVGPVGRLALDPEPYSTHATHATDSTDSTHATDSTYGGSTLSRHLDEAAPTARADDLSGRTSSTLRSSTRDGIIPVQYTRSARNGQTIYKSQMTRKLSLEA